LAAYFLLSSRIGKVAKVLFLGGKTCPERKKVAWLGCSLSPAFNLSFYNFSLPNFGTVPANV
jgi:hypothetical protein